jgi:hypothetical protein
MFFRNWFLHIRDSAILVQWLLSEVDWNVQIRIVQVFLQIECWAAKRNNTKTESSRLLRTSLFIRTWSCEKSFRRNVLRSCHWLSTSNEAHDNVLLLLSSDENRVSQTQSGNQILNKSGVKLVTCWSWFRAGLSLLQWPRQS